MIIKPYGIDKVNLDKNSLILLYGNNEGLKKEIIKKLTKDQKKIFNLAINITMTLDQKISKLERKINRAKAYR